MISEVDVVLIITFGGYGFLTLVGYLLNLYARLKLRGVEKESDFDSHYFQQEVLLSISEESIVRKLYNSFSETNFGVYWNFIQLLCTLISLYLYVHELYEFPNISDAFLIAEVVVASLISIDFVGNWVISANKGLYFLSFYPFIDWVTVIPFWVLWIGYNDPFNQQRSDSNALLLLRSLRLFRALRAIRVYRLLPKQDENDLLRYQVIKSIIGLLILLFISVSIMQFIEDNLSPIAGLPSNAPFPWHTSLYFMVVTLTTTGYGDIVPRTEAGRAIIMIIVVLAISLVPYFVSAVNEVIRHRNIFDTTRITNIGRQYDHVLIIGVVNYEEMELFLSEWLHKDNANANTKIGIVSAHDADVPLRKLITSRFSLCFFFFFFFFFSVFLLKILF
jgi:hypothetical protein